MSPPPSFDDIARPRRTTGFHFGDIPRLGLASRGDTNLSADLVLRAIERGVRYLNWCGRPDGMSEAIRSLSPEERERIVIAVQLEARSRNEAQLELDRYLAELGTSLIDVVTHYWVESEAEWEEIEDVSHGARGNLLQARADGRVRNLGITTHQRRLAAMVASRDRSSVIMARYNAA
ncbi:MAG TPA: hypothetical protein VK116_11435, partial [Planctomycetota bacterium]|nr:hypothetical protein [Planctomycetota bacterium]